MNYKKKKAKNQRSGCLMCNYWKMNGVRTESRYGESYSAHVRRSVMDEELREIDPLDEYKFEMEMIELRKLGV